MSESGTNFAAQEKDVDSTTRHDDDFLAAIDPLTGGLRATRDRTPSDSGRYEDPRDPTTNIARAIQDAVRVEMARQLDDLETLRAELESRKNVLDEYRDALEAREAAVKIREGDLDEKYAAAVASAEAASEHYNAMRLMDEDLREVVDKQPRLADLRLSCEQIVAETAGERAKRAEYLERLELVAEKLKASPVGRPPPGDAPEQEGDREKARLPLPTRPGAKKHARSKAAAGVDESM